MLYAIDGGERDRSAMVNQGIDPTLRLLRLAMWRWWPMMTGRAKKESPNFALHMADVFDWAASHPQNSVHAIVTDPPYGLKEYNEAEKQKMRRGRGGVWRIPPSFNGCKRSPLPRFTVLDESDKDALREFFVNFATMAMRLLVPGGHIFIATNPLLSHFVYIPLMDAGFEKRGEIIRLVQTLRGGDRPKNAHEEFTGVSVMPRSRGNHGDCFASHVTVAFRII